MCKGQSGRLRLDVSRVGVYRSHRSNSLDRQLVPDLQPRADIQCGDLVAYASFEYCLHATASSRCCILRELLSNVSSAQAGVPQGSPAQGQQGSWTLQGQVGAACKHSYATATGTLTALLPMRSLYCH